MEYEAIEFHHNYERVASISLNRTARLFHPHVTYGMTSAIEPIGLGPPHPPRRSAVLGPAAVVTMSWSEPRTCSAAGGPRVPDPGGESPGLTFSGFDLPESLAMLRDVVARFVVEQIRPPEEGTGAGGPRPPGRNREGPAKAGPGCRPLVPRRSGRVRRRGHQRLRIGGGVGGGQPAPLLPSGARRRGVRLQPALPDVPGQRGPD